MPSLKPSDPPSLTPSLNGVLLVNKAKGFTSHDVVGKLRKIFKTKTVGHAGTLDPMAEGLLVILIGEATKLSRIITSENKDYIAQMDFGYTTDTLDAEGQVVNKTSNVDLSLSEITQEVEKLKGDLELEVPLYSAVKVKGKKLYDYARSGVDVQAPVRTMRFYKAEVLSAKPTQAQVYLKCEKGAYIRSWVHQLGQNLETGATMTSLVRQKSGDFNLNDSLSLSSLEDLLEQSQNFEAFIHHIQENKCYRPLEDCLKGPFYRLEGFDVHLMQNGQIPKSLNQRLTPWVHRSLELQKDQILRVYQCEKGVDRLLALIEISAVRPKPKILRVFKC